MVPTVEATRRMERNCRSRHMTLWRSLKAPGAIQSFGFRSETGAGCQNPAATQRPTQTRIHAKNQNSAAEAASTSTRTQAWEYETKSVRRMYAADAPMGAWERKRVRFPRSGFQRDFPSASCCC